jgi:hypothetical protein
MLALTYLHIGDGRRQRQEMTVLKTLAAHTDEDYLFKGYAQYWSWPDQGLQILNEAVERSRSPLARAIRADVRASLADRDFDFEQAELALRDIRAAEEYLPNNPLVMSISVLVRLGIANLHRDAKRPEHHQTLLKEASPHVDQLTHWNGMPYPALALWSYYAMSENEEKVFEFAQRAAKGSSTPSILCRYAILLCRRGEYAEALSVIDQRKWNEPEGDSLRIYILAELHADDPQIAVAANEEFANRYRYSPQVDEESPYSQFEFYRLNLMLLGLPNESREAYRVAKTRLPKDIDELEPPIVDYCCGDRSETDLLNISGDRWFRFHAYNHVALKQLASGDRSRAIENFRNARSIRMYAFVPWELANNFVLRMEDDPNWPPWIPLKKK